MTKTNYRTDRNNNPTAFTVNVAKEAGLKLGQDYAVGDAFPVPSKEFTALLLGNPINVTIKTIDKIGFYTSLGFPRWIYITIPKFLWDAQDYDTKKKIVHFMYQREGGMALEPLFH